MANSESKQKTLEIIFKYKNVLKYRETLVKDTYSEMSPKLTLSCSLNFKHTVSSITVCVARMNHRNIES